MSTIRTISTTAAIAVVVATGALAQGRRPDPQRMEFAKELHTELRTFAQQNVLPVLRQWKAKLDGAMSAEDLATLNGLRARAARFRTAMMEHGQGLRQAWKDEDYDALRRHRNAMKEMKGEMQAIMTDLKPLAQKYQSTLEAIGQEAKPAVEGWKTDGKALVQKWMAAHKDVLGDRPMPPMMHRGGPMPGMFDGRGKGMVVRFMLWDGQDLPELQQPGPQDGPPMMMPDGPQDLD